MARIAIIGAGVSGLACAARLQQEGLKPVVFDKGRGIGGRMATRRVGDDMRFDHGARSLTATTPGFQAVLDGAEQAGAIATWQSADGVTCYAGVPGMTAFPKFLGRDVEIRQNVQVREVRSQGTAFDLSADGDLGTFDLVVCTAPAPQSLGLVGDILGQTAFDAVRYDPCLTLLVALHTRPDLPDVAADPTDAFAWVARDGAKPGRTHAECWVVQGNAQFSARHLEASKDEICALLLDRFLAHAGLAASDVAYATAHRWRHALVAQPLGQPFLCTPDGGLYAGGDWCLGPTAEHAWASGMAIADDLLRKV